MLQAKNGQGELVTPAAYSMNKLKQLKESKQAFYCPICKESVILRAGRQVIAHFAHQAKTNCLSARGEGPYHEKGKLMLYEWLLRQGITVQLEKYLPEINQRPDLYFHLAGRAIAFEYQCVAISTNEIIERTTGYQQVGIQVIWILGEKQLHRMTSQLIKLNAFSKKMIHQFSAHYPPSLFYFCPLQALFIKYQDFSFLSTQRAAGQLTISPYQTMNIKQLFLQTNISDTTLLRVWKREKRAFRLKRRTRSYGQQLAWQQWLYLKGLHIDHLPSYIYLPVPGDFTMKSASWIWQSRICIDLIAPLKIGQTFTVQRCYYLVKNHMEKPTHYPLLTEQANPVLHYLHLLCELGILEEITSGQFKKLIAIEQHPNVGAAVAADEKLLDQLFGRNDIL